MHDKRIVLASGTLVCVSVGLTFVIQQIVESRAYEHKKTESIAAARENLRQFGIREYESLEYAYFKQFEPNGVKMPERVSIVIKNSSPSNADNYGYLPHPPRFGYVSLPRNIEPIATFRTPLIERDVFRTAKGIAQHFLQKGAKLRVYCDLGEITEDSDYRLVIDHIYIEATEKNGTIRMWIINCSTGKLVRIGSRYPKKY